MLRLGRIRFTRNIRQAHPDGDLVADPADSRVLMGGR